MRATALVLSVAFALAATAVVAADRPGTSASPPQADGDAIDAQLLLDLDLLRDPELTERRPILERLGLLQSLRLLERFNLLDAQTRAPAPPRPQ